MNEDYLWDRSGEPDPEVEHLEDLLGRFRHQRPALDLPIRPRRRITLRLVAAAVLFFVALTAGVWMALHRGSAPTITRSTVELHRKTEKIRNQEHLSQKAEVEPRKRADEQQAHTVPTLKSPSRSLPREPEESRQERSEVSPDIEDVAQFEPVGVPLLDVETASHIEKAQVLLRSFRNAHLSNGERAADIAYEKRLSRELLSTNILLRRNAEARGNLPMAELLSSLEPFLLDIANLQNGTDQDDVRSIRQRIQRKEIIAELQLYTARPSGASF